MRFAMTVAAACAAALAAVPAQAAIVTYNGVIEADPFIVGNQFPGRTDFLYFIQRTGVVFTLSGGDILRGTLQVADGRSITVQDNGNGLGIDALLLAASTSDNFAVRYTSKMSLGGLSGNYVGASEYTSGSTNSELNNLISASMVGNLTNSTFSFRTINFEITMLDGPRSDFRLFTLQSPGQFFAGYPVPEPSTWLMSIAGFGGLAAQLRRRRKPLSAA